MAFLLFSLNDRDSVPLKICVYLWFISVIGKFSTEGRNIFGGLTPLFLHFLRTHVTYSRDGALCHYSNLTVAGWRAVPVLLPRGATPSRDAQQHQCQVSACRRGRLSFRGTMSRDYLLQFFLHDWRFLHLELRISPRIFGNWFVKKTWSRKSHGIVPLRQLLKYSGRIWKGYVYIASLI